MYRIVCILCFLVIKRCFFLQIDKMNRARNMLNMATSVQESEKVEVLPGHNNNVQNKTIFNTPAALSLPVALPIDSSDTTSIADSQPDLNLSILEDEDSEISCVTNTKDTNRPKIVVEQSDPSSSPIINKQ